MTFIKQYLLNMLMAVDQFLSTLLLGHPDDTISQRLGRAKLAKKTGIVIWCGAAVDFMAWVLVREKDHIINSMRGKTLAKELWNWGGSRSDVKVEEDL